MKKIMTILLVTLLSIGLTSCGKTKFEDLPKEKQEEITNYYIGKTATIIGEMFQIAFDFELSEEEREKKGDELVEKAKDIFENDLKKQYSNVDFGSYEEWNEATNEIDNSTETQKEYTSVPLGEFQKFEPGKIYINHEEGEEINVKISDIVWKGNQYGDGWSEYTAKNEYLFIKFQSENIGKKPTFFDISDGRLVTTDGYEYKHYETLQIKKEERDEGFGGCIGCESNPGEKNEEYLIFDIPKIDLAGAKLRFENDLVDFEL